MVSILSRYWKTKLSLLIIILNFEESSQTSEIHCRISGTYMVEVEGEERNTGLTEERMVGVDLSKGVILEIQITSGKTFAKHNLGKNRIGP